ncbi:putative iron-dependent peroxidase [Corynebacterium renale]|uniref:Deferrochelatase n=1 Tax=Corynebacterium renale TaxID=1724 RepID=A0A2A9DP41_9CORY|nr:iron uptake transporter deferrochelatase/peroxidase subunit [Corynebacterium renale]PFG28151.1 deferrochelatase/peroxidase EfeB [Corynebacterium renale]SQG65258.1 putative iron-dependent peroxidase [Corynebacterium renale]SQI20369.1 putative iron-dependent peroxidase [Corynebacterium renale]STC98529.1 putative iron-dependent peroxidase [Corynebacterium renale]
MSPQVNRRQLLLGGAGLGALAGVAAGGFGLGRSQAQAEDVFMGAVDFRGEHQSGIVTPAQQQMIMVAFDMVADRRADLIDLLEKWTLAAERMQAGELVNDPKARDDVPPDDTGEAMDLAPAALTITFGFGATLFNHPEKGDRYGIADKCPEILAAGIPRMAAEKIDPAKSHGDLVVQICAEDPMVVLHAMHQFKRIAFGTASVRWMQLGYGRTSSTSKDQQTPRNLFGFKDGTGSLKGEDPAELLDGHVWIQPGDDQGDWAAGGSYLCFRKIHMMMEVWDELVLNEQETIIGRNKIEGAPLSGGEEFTHPDFSTEDIAEDSHLAVVHPDNNGGAHMLRRGYNYTEGLTDLGRLDAGLFFIAFVRDPQVNFINILSKMAGDQLTEYLQHTATGMFICPPGIREGDTFVGQTLLG